MYTTFETSWAIRAQPIGQIFIFISCYLNLNVCIWAPKNGHILQQGAIILKKNVESGSQIITSAPGLGDLKLTPVKKMLAIMI